MWSHLLLIHRKVEGHSAATLQLVRMQCLANGHLGSKPQVLTISLDHGSPNRWSVASVQTQTVLYADLDLQPIDH